ncbi:MAG: hypothetical protein K1Y36_04345 [Blastocatellia bacterium]|nr:hypothetical protein [Blastocatellia bacterium]
MRLTHLLSMIFVTGLVCGLAGTGTAQTKASADKKAVPALASTVSGTRLSPDDPRFFPLKDVKVGLKGIARTIFQGDTPEEFGVEVLGVLPGTPAPNQSLIIVRLSGANAERTGVFAGMSGSPVFVNGKLLGAIAYSFPFSKEPIGGVTPIEQMVTVFANKSEPANQQQVRGPYSFQDLVAGRMDPPSLAPNSRQPAMIGTAAASTPTLVPYVGQTLMPIATPLSVSGIPADVLQGMTPQLEALGFRVVAGASGAAPLGPPPPITDETLTPGRTVCAQLSKGDFSFSAAGTVTWRDGDQILAFGHPFLGIGGTALPMSEGSVITVIPNLNNSFKLVNPAPTIGSVTEDRSSGIRGRLGEYTPLVGITINVNSRGIPKSYRFEAVQDPLITPFLVNVGVIGALSATERVLGDLTLQMQGKIELDGQPSIELSNAYTSRFNPAVNLGAAVAQPLTVLLGSGFDNIKLKEITINIVATDSRSNATLDRLSASRTEVRRGETLELQAFARNANGQSFVERIPIQIPADARPGLTVVTVSDGGTLGQTERRTPPDPKDFGQLVRAVNRLRKNNRLYVKLLRSESGAVVNNEEMPSLPPSMLAVLGSNRSSGGYQPLAVTTIYEKELPPSQLLITGQQTLTIEIVK